MNLADYRKGNKGTVLRIEGDPDFKKRMMEMGFVRGTKVRVVKYAPLADPVELLVKGYHLTLRKTQAACILMTEPASGN